MRLRKNTQLVRKYYVVEYHALFCNNMKYHSTMVVNGISQDNATDNAIDILCKRHYKNIKIDSCNLI